MSTKFSDVDECAESLCGSLKCLNYLGSYSCIHPAGYLTGNDGHCARMLQIHLHLTISLSSISCTF